MQIIERASGAVVEVVENDYVVFCAEYDCNGFVFCTILSEKNGVEDEYSVEFSGDWESLTKEQKIVACKK